MREVNVMNVSRWPNVRNLIDIRKTSSFVVCFGPLNGEGYTHILDVLSGITETKSVSLFFLDGNKESCNGALEELGITQYPVIAVFKDGKCTSTVVPDKTIVPEDVICLI